jgi:hypothetical protein
MVKRRSEAAEITNPKAQNPKKDQIPNSKEETGFWSPSPFGH